MQTTYRLKAHEISMTFLKSVKNLFAGQEVEITVKSVAPNEKEFSLSQKRLLEMIYDNRKSAPVIDQGVDIRTLIDESQFPVE